MKGFIEVLVTVDSYEWEDFKFDSFKMMISVRKISSFNEKYICVGNKSYRIKQSYEEIKELIKNAQ